MVLMQRRSCRSEIMMGEVMERVEERRRKEE